jgi:hypothetical protein
MKIHLRRTCLMILAITVLASLARAQSQAEIDKAIEANLGDPAKFQSVMTELKQGVAKHDAAAVAALVSYPITVNPRTKKAKRVPTAGAFVASYDRIITAHIADVIEKQKYDDLFVNYQGAMFGSGEVWIASICKDKQCKESDIKVKTIQNTAGNKK